MHVWNQGEVRPLASFAMMGDESDLFQKPTGDKVVRCDACGAVVHDEQEAIGDGLRHRGCPREPRGHVLMVPINVCAVDGCGAARHGQPLPSGQHFAEHMDWHRQQWAKEETAVAALPMEAPTPPVLRTVDVWCNESVTVSPGCVQVVSLASPVDGARCVAVLAYPPLAALVVGCEPMGAVPLAAYVDAGGGAVVPVEGVSPADCYEVEAHNEGACELTLRLGARWELPGDG